MSKEELIGRKVKIVDSYRNVDGVNYDGKIGTIISTGDALIECRMDDGVVLNPYIKAPEYGVCVKNNQPQCELLPQYPEYKVGQRVYVHSGDNIGRTGEGVVTEVDKDYHIQPCIQVDLIKVNSTLNCYPSENREFNVEILEEEKQYSYEKIKGTKVAVNCRTLEEWNKVLAITGNVRSLSERDWAIYGENNCINMKDGRYSRVVYYQQEGYKTITAQQFLHDNNQQSEVMEQDNRWYVKCVHEEYGMKKGEEYEVVKDEGPEYAGRMRYEVLVNGFSKWPDTINVTDKYQKQQNTQTMNTSIQDKIEQLEKQQKELQQSIEALKEQAKQPQYKVGDWVYLIDTGTSVSTTMPDGQEHYGANPGIVSKIIGITDKGGNASMSDLRYYGSNWNVRGVDIRPATQAEIDAAQKKTVTIGTDTKITIEKGKITGPDGKQVLVLSVRALIDNMKKQYTGIPWTISNMTCTIGCATQVTVAQLEKVIREYDKINAI